MEAVRVHFHHPEAFLLMISYFESSLLQRNVLLLFLSKRCYRLDDSILRFVVHFGLDQQVHQQCEHGNILSMQKTAQPIVRHSSFQVVCCKRKFSFFTRADEK